MHNVNPYLLQNDVTKNYKEKVLCYCLDETVTLYQCLIEWKGFLKLSEKDVLSLKSPSEKSSCLWLKETTESTQSKRLGNGAEVHIQGEAGRRL